MKYLYQHLGLGDHILLNGLIRVLAKKHGNVSLFCKTHNFETVNYMFSDEPNITVLPFENDPQVIQFINQNRLQPNLIKIGHENFSECIPNINFDKCFYRQFNIDFDNRWSSFFVPRNLENELKIYNSFNLNKNEYIFIHDDERYRIDESKIKSNLPKIRISKGITPNIFDFSTLIENAAEGHFIESSFQFMNDSLNLNKNTFVHRYCRSLPPWEIPEYKFVKEIFE